MSTAPRFIPFCEHVLEALDLWVGLGAERLQDTAWKHVELTEPETWPSDEEIENGDYYYSRHEVERLLLAGDWIASVTQALADHNSDKEAQP